MYSSFDLHEYTCIVLHNHYNHVCLFSHVYIPLPVPPPTMSVSLSPSGIIYESTLLVITCNATLPSTVDTVVTATVTWTGPNGLANSTNGRIIVDPAISVDDNIFQSQLTFQPVDNGDTEKEVNDAGQYTCEMAIISTDSLILTGTNDITEDIVVTGGSMFIPVI